jgi:hypothetical protein
MEPQVFGYIIKSSGYIFFIKERRTFDRNGQPISHLYEYGKSQSEGTNDGRCMIVTVETPLRYEVFKGRDDVMAMAHTKSNIQWIEFDKVCSLSAPLIRGEGTRTMVRAVLSFILGRHNWIRAFTLTDASTVECNNASVSLVYLSLALNGSTWYGKHFGAQPCTEHARAKYEQNLYRWTNQVYKRETTWDMFLAMADIPMAIVADVQEEYAKASNMQDLFRRLDKRYPRDGSGGGFCRMFYEKEPTRGNEWGPTVVERIIGLDHKELNGNWCIGVEGFPLADIRWKQMEDPSVVPDASVFTSTMFGGRRYTLPELSKMSKKSLSMWKKVNKK